MANKLWAYHKMPVCITFSYPSVSFFYQNNNLKYIFSYREKKREMHKTIMSTNDFFSHAQNKTLEECKISFVWSKAIVSLDSNVSPSRQIMPRPLKLPYNIVLTDTKWYRFVTALPAHVAAFPPSYSVKVILETFIGCTTQRQSSFWVSRDWFKVDFVFDWETEGDSDRDSWKSTFIWMQKLTT